MSALVLSVFPGIGLLDMAFEGEGFCVVRGPDLFWGGDVKRFRPPAGCFDGVIGGDPCQAHSKLEGFCLSRGCVPHEDLTPEYRRVVIEAQPRWYLRENVPGAPAPAVPGYEEGSVLLNARDFGCEQNRQRRFWFGVRGGGYPVDLWRYLEIEPLRPVVCERAVLASGGRRIAMLRTRAEMARNLPSRREADFHRALELQGLPSDFLSGAPFTKEGRYRAVGNGVPLPMGRGVARAVRLVLEAMP
ncbi:MAG: DNA cytosine methyltransferase [Dehalococcoidia bacterium]|nr:DNA cytosine methyltransferase [Dehalococcoidia bacterium]